MNLAHDDGLLPRVDLNGIFVPPIEYMPCSDTASISVDVMSVTGAAAIDVKGEIGVFYDSEILAIVHRFKTKSTGLVETSLWSWRGRRSQIGEREERKLRDLARHYGTKLCHVRQSCEPPELVHALGGRLAIRQVRISGACQVHAAYRRLVLLREHVRTGVQGTPPCTRSAVCKETYSSMSMT